MGHSPPWGPVGLGVVLDKDAGREPCRALCSGDVSFNSLGISLKEKISFSQCVNSCSRVGGLKGANSGSSRKGIGRMQFH